MDGCDETYSVDEFKEQLGLSHTEWASKRHSCRQWFFWKSNGTEIQDKIKLALEAVASSVWNTDRYLAQFWAPDQRGRLYLATSDQPFSVSGGLLKGVCWYRRRCLGHRYRGDDEAALHELGGVGRAYRKKQIESTPDLRLYSSAEFPLRDHAVACGFRSYYAIPLFDLRTKIFYGVTELLCFHRSSPFSGFYSGSLEVGLEEAQLTTTPHLNSSLEEIALDSEIVEMVELAMAEIPQLHMSQIWAPCHECPNVLTSRMHFFDCWKDEDSMYLKACELHKVEIREHTFTPARAALLSKHRACVSTNICDFSIIDYPLAHYAQKACLSFCFAIRLESSHDSSHIFLVEFYLQPNTSEDAFVGLFLPLLLRIMEIKLKSFEFPYKGQLGQELLVEILNPKGAIRHATIPYQHQHIREKRFEDDCTSSDFLKYSTKTDMYYSEECEEVGRVFWSKEIEGSSEDNSSVLLMSPNAIQMMIKYTMSEITSILRDRDPYFVAQFWAPKMDGDRRCLKTSTQPFAVGRLCRGLAVFRGQSTEHCYFVDDRAKEDELGPPGRVFLNRIPEMTSDLRVYSPTEFPLRNHAADCGFRYYCALPMFDLDQHTCVGVLELMTDKNSLIGFTKLSLQLFMEYLRPSYSHHNFHRSPTWTNSAKGRESALTEIEAAFKTFNEIPQLVTVEVWVSLNECPNNKNSIRCMGQVLTYPAPCWPKIWQMREFQHVEARKGIVGMVMASENNTCFCRNICEFSITEQSSARFAQQEGRLDICFAICLQSRHTADLLYVLEFYLNQGPRNCEGLGSFLRLLLPMLKQTLESFKVASGQELGEKLVVEVIEFSELNEFASYEMHQPDELQFIFKFVRYGGQKHLTEKQTRFAADGMESDTIVGMESDTIVGVESDTVVGVESDRNAAEVEHCNSLKSDRNVEGVDHCSAANLKKNDAAMGRKEGNKGTGLNISFKDLQSHFGHKRKDAAKALNVSESTFKRACKRHGIERWPHNEKYIKNPSLFMREGAAEITGNSQQDTGQFNLVASDMPSHTNPESSQDNQSSFVKEGPNEMAEDSNQQNMPLPQNISHSILEMLEDVMVPPKVDMVVIKPKYKDCTLRIEFCRSEGLEKLWNEVGRRLKMSVGSFDLKYLDEDNDEILLACDDDLQLCLRNPAALGKPYFPLLVQSKIVDCQIPTWPSFGIQCIPSVFHEHISRTKDVKGDGHCGFRAIADLVGFGEDGWRVVRSDLLRELRQHPQLYTNAFIEHGAIKKIEKILDCFEDSATEEYYFTLPEMGHLIATVYNVCLITLSQVQSMTFLPLRTPVPDNSVVISMALINDVHFIEVFLRPGHPTPAVTAAWYKCRHECAAGWDLVVRQQTLLYSKLSRNNNMLVETINVDD